MRIIKNFIFQIAKKFLNSNPILINTINKFIIILFKYSSRSSSLPLYNSFHYDILSRYFNSLSIFLHFFFLYTIYMYISFHLVYRVPFIYTRTEAVSHLLSLIHFLYTYIYIHSFTFI